MHILGAAKVLSCEDRKCVQNSPWHTSASPHAFAVLIREAGDANARLFCIATLVEFSRG